LKSHMQRSSWVADVGLSIAEQLVYSWVSLIQSLIQFNVYYTLHIKNNND